MRDDPETAELWDASSPLPEPGDRPRFDRFLAARNITRGALARTAARYADGEEDVVLWCWRGGTKSRDLATGRRWNSLGFRPDHAHIMEPFDGRTGAVLLVAEGETDAARLHLMYRFASVAVLPLGAEYIPPCFADQATAFDAVYACQDADAAGDAGAALLASKLPQVVRHRPPENEPHNDWASVPPDEDPPALPQAPDACGTIIFEDFATLLEQDLPEPVQLVPNVLYDEGVHWLSGEPDSGKSTLAVAFALQAMAMAVPVVWLDFEGGATPSARRFKAAGMTAAIARAHFHYAGWPQDPEASLGAVAARWPGAVVVFDSASKAQSAHGIEENDNSAVTKWTVSLVRAAKQHGLALVVIDHISKGARESNYARGAGSKQADTDVHWRAIKITDFDRNNAGCVQLVRKKDREGYLPAALWFAVGDGKGGLPVTPCDPPLPPDEDPDNPPRRSAF